MKKYGANFVIEFQDSQVKISIQIGILENNKYKQEQKKKTSNVTNGMSSLTFIYTSQVKKTKTKQILINEFEKGKQVQTIIYFDTPKILLQCNLRLGN